MKMMKKVVITGKRKAEIVEVPVPKPKEDWVLVKIHVTPMCTEYKEFNKGDRWEYIGHEAAGEVVEVAQGKNIKVGDRVVVMPQYPCGKCQLCIEGDYIYCENSYKLEEYFGSKEGSATYAQYMLKPEKLLYRIPDGVSYEKASLACCGIGPSFGAFSELNVNAFDTVLVTGLGPVGIGAVINARYRGARVIGVEPNEYRADIARKMGADAVFHPDDPELLAKIKSLCGGIGPDSAVECSGIPSAHRICIDAVRRRGQVAFVGECHDDTVVKVSPDLIRKGIKLIGVWFYNIRCLKDVMAIIQNSPLIDGFISHSYPMSRIQDALEMLSTPEHGKIILKPWE